MSQDAETNRKPRTGVDVENYNTSENVTERRLYESLQIDGLQPPRSSIKEYLKRFQKKLKPDGQRAPRDTDEN